MDSNCKLAGGLSASAKTSYSEFASTAGAIISKPGRMGSKMGPLDTWEEMCRRHQEEETS